LGNDGAICQPGGLYGKGYVIVLESGATANQRVKWAFSTGREMRSSPLVVDGSIYVGGRVRRRILALDSTGTSLWADVESALNNLTSSPALSRDGNTLYIGGFDGRLHAISRETGQEQWSVGRTENARIRLPERDDGGNVPRDFTTAGHIPEAPAVGSDGTVHFGSWDGHLYAVSPQGELKWLIDLKDRVTSAPALPEDGHVLVSTYEGTLCAVRMRSGKPALAWSVKANARYSSPLISADKKVSVGTLDGKLRAYRLNDGARLGEISSEGGSTPRLFQAVTAYSISEARTAISVPSNEAQREGNMCKNTATGILFALLVVGLSPAQDDGLTFDRVVELACEYMADENAARRSEILDEIGD